MTVFICQTGKAKLQEGKTDHLLPVVRDAEKG